jgi:dihydrofolate synthase/folylpolyglutamate synthase
VITSISFDHTRQLGDTLASIAAEKAGIIKPGVPVVSGVVQPEPREVIRRVCAQRGCRLAELGTEFEFDYRPPPPIETAPASGQIDFRWRGADKPCQYRALSLGLLGAHQAANAAVALAVLMELKEQGWTIPDEAIRTGLAQVVWPARIEVLGRRPTIVLDVAHNVASIEALLRVLDESFTASRRLLVFAATREKDATGMLQRLLGRFDEVIFTRYVDNPRAVSPEELEAAAANLAGRRYRVCPDPAAAWDEVCRRASPDDLVCVTGSFFLAAEMRKLIESRPIPAPVQGGARESA